MQDTYKLPYKEITRSVLLIALGLTLLNLLFKTILISDYSLWFDESHTVHWAQLPFNSIKGIGEWDISAPFYYYVVHCWTKLFGISEFSVRFMSVFFNVLAGLSLVLFTFRFFNKRTALFAFAIFFSSDVLYFYAQEVRTYSFLLWLTVCSSWLFLEILYRPKWWHVLLLGVVNWMGIYSHYLYLLVPFYQTIAAIAYWKKKPFIHFALAGTLTLGILNVWLLRMLEVFQLGGNSTLSSNSLWYNIERLLDGTINVVAFAVLAGVGAYFFFKKHAKNRSELIKVLYLTLLSVGTVLIVFIVGQNGSMFIPRYILFCTIGFYVLIGYLGTFIPMHKGLFYGLTGVLAVLSLTQIDYTVNKNMNFKEAVKRIQELQDDRTLVLIQSHALEHNFTYYYNKEVFSHLEKTSGRLAKYNTRTLDDAKELQYIDFRAYKRVILTQTFSDFTDPEGTVIKAIKCCFQDQTTTQEFAGMKFHVFENNAQYDPNVATLANPKVRLQQIRDKMEEIRNNVEWYKGVEQKAKNWSKSIEEVLFIDALYMLSMDEMEGDRAAMNRVQIIEEQIEKIKNNPEWYSQTQQKAKEWGMSIDSVLFIDASYVLGINHEEVWKENQAALSKQQQIEEQIEIIKQNPEWYQQIQDKARTLEIPVDSMLLIDAKYIIGIK